MEAQKTINKEITLLVDPDLVSFFDLLAKFDYEDKQKDKVIKTPEIKVEDNSNSKPAVRTSGKTCSAKQ